MRIALLLISLLWQPLGYAKDALQVYLAGESQPQISYPEPVRLEQVLVALNAPASTYWLAATFGDKTEQAVVADQYNQLQQRLRALQAAWHDKPERQQAVTMLMQQLAQVTFVAKQFYSVDRDQVRLDPAKNPLLTGQFIFYFPSRVNTVKVMGLVEQARIVPHQAGEPIATYLAQVTRLANAELGQVRVIEADGSVALANTGYWLKPATQLAPGAILFVGFASLPADFSDLNRDIAELLRYHSHWWE